MEQFIIDNTSTNFQWDVRDLLQCLQRGRRIVYTKFGDGEYMCINKPIGRNCDNDTYSAKLGGELQKAFCSLVVAFNEQNESVWIGMWREPHVSTYFARLYYQYKTCIGALREHHTIPFVEYHTVYNSHDSLTNSAMYDFVKYIQTYPNGKIVISNPQNRRLLSIFRAAEYVNIPSHSWYAHGMYDSIRTKLEDFLNAHPKSIVILACGLATKVLIADVMKRHPQASFIDIGSGFDLLARRVDTRGWTRGTYHHTYLDECTYYKDLLPENWESLPPVFLR